MVEKACLRAQLQNGKRRHDVPIMNGFRRFWNKVSKETLSKDSALASLIKKEFMLGHAGLTKFDRNYFKIHIWDYVKEYLALVPDLTISNENRLRVENARLRKDQVTIEDLRADMNEMKGQMELNHDLALIEYEKDLIKRKERFDRFCEKHNLDKNKPIPYTISVDKDRHAALLEFCKISDEVNKKG